MDKAVLTIAFILFTHSPIHAQTFTNKVEVGLKIEAQDGGSGIGEGSQMQFSNDGFIWTPPEPYAQSKSSWNLNDYGGDSLSSIKRVYMKVSDRLGNWSDTIQSSQVTIDNKGPDGSVLIELTVTIGEE